MRIQTDKTSENRDSSNAHHSLADQTHSKSTQLFSDSGPDAITQRKLQQVADNSPQAHKIAQFQAMADKHTAAQLKQGKPANSQVPSVGIIQGKFTDELAGQDVDAIYAELNKRYDGVKVAHKWKLREFKQGETPFGSLADIARELGLSLKTAPEITSPEREPLREAPKLAPKPEPSARPEPKVIAKPGPKPEKAKVEKAKPLIIPAIPEPELDKGVKVPLEELPKEVGMGKATKYEPTRLRQLIDGLYKKSPKPKKEHFIQALVGEYHPGHIIDIVESRDFVYGFQAAVRQQIRAQGRYETFLGKTEITEVAEEETDISQYKMNDISKWTLRHYSDKGDETNPPPFKEIRSALALGILLPAKEAESGSKKKSGHTGDVDWYKYGNVGSTFYLLYIDGQVVQKQKFLANAKWYAEFSLSEIPNMWVSSDWLDEDAIKGLALRGSGSAIHKSLLKLGGKLGGNFFRRNLESQFNNFEVKVPGKLAVKQWYKA